MTGQRNSINEIVPKKLYQRGQINSWPRDAKVKLIKDKNIRVIVNLWTKSDSDMNDSLVEQYIYIPVSSKATLSPLVSITAGAVARFLKKEKGAALILCEAGKTRSVFFTILVVRRYLGISLKKAYKHVVNIVKKHRLKPYMIDYCNGNHN